MAARQASSKAPPLTPFLIEAYDVTVIFVTSRGAKIQYFGAPEGDDLAAGVDGVAVTDVSGSDLRASGGDPGTPRTPT